jgi:membrane fusion protein (multidrug efflux system)
MKFTPFICAVLVLAGNARAAEAPALKVTHPKRGEITRFVTLPGTIRANQQATLCAKVPGYLKSIAVDKGDSVNEDQALGEIEVPELVADIAKYDAELKVAEIEFERVTSAAKKAPDLVTAQSLSEAEGKRKVAWARLDQAATLLKYSHIAAPFSGVITQRFVDPGAFIAVPTGGGATAAAAIVTIADFRTVRVQVAVPEVEASFVSKGQPVKFSVEGLPGKSFEAQVSRFSYALDEATRTMLVEADMANPDLTLRPGMYAMVKVGVEKKEDALLVPAEAIVMEKTNAFVFTFADGKAKKTAVKLGFNDGTNAEITSGVTEQDRVLVVGKTTLADGQAVNSKETP